MIPRYVPAEPVMLQNSGLGTFHHMMIRGRRKKQTDNGSVRNDADHSGKDPLIPFRQKRFLLKAGAVIGIDRKNTVLNIPFTEGCRVNRQISAFGVSADTQTAREISADPVQVLNCPALSFCFGQKTEIEILFPADQRSVCSAKRDISRLIRQQDRYGRELHIPGAFRFIQEPAQPDIPVSGAAEHLLHQQRRSCCKRFARKDFLMRMVPEKSLASLLQGNISPVYGKNSSEIRVGQFCQNQIVHFIERVSGKGYVAAPFQIVKDIPHDPFSPSSSGA